MKNMKAIREKALGKARMAVNLIDCLEDDVSQEFLAGLMHHIMGDFALLVDELGYTFEEAQGFEMLIEKIMDMIEPVGPRVPIKEETIH